MTRQMPTTPRKSKPSPQKPPVRRRATPTPKKKDPFEGVDKLDRQDRNRRNIFR